eukprot:gene45649-31763_t
MDGSFGNGRDAWYGIRDEAHQRCLAAGASCQFLLDWNCDSSHGWNGWRYCRAVPGTGDGQSCVRAV